MFTKRWLHKLSNVWILDTKIISFLHLVSHMCLGRRCGDGLYWGNRKHVSRRQGGRVRCPRPTCHSHVPRLWMLWVMVWLMLLLVVRRVRLVWVQLSSVAIVFASRWTRNTKTREEARITFCGRASRYSSGDGSCCSRWNGHDRLCSIAQFSESRRRLREFKILFRWKYETCAVWYGSKPENITPFQMSEDCMQIAYIVCKNIFIQNLKIVFRPLSIAQDIQCSMFVTNQIRERELHSQMTSAKLSGFFRPPPPMSVPNPHNLPSPQVLTSFVNVKPISEERKGGCVISIL